MNELTDTEKVKVFENLSQMLKLHKLDVMESVTDMVKGFFNEHLLYHKENEHRWGITKLMSLHPWKTLFMGMVIIIVIIILFGSGFDELCKILVYKLF